MCHENRKFKLYNHDKWAIKPIIFFIRDSLADTVLPIQLKKGGEFLRGNFTMVYLMSLITMHSYYKKI